MFVWFLIGTVLGLNIAVGPIAVLISRRVMCCSPCQRECVCSL